MAGRASGRGLCGASVLGSHVALRKAGGRHPFTLAFGDLSAEGEEQHVFICKETEISIQTKT